MPQQTPPRSNPPENPVSYQLSERYVAVLGSDGIQDAFPPMIKEELNPIHKLTLSSMGLPLLDDLNLEESS